jgi:hypothetical protein
MGGCVSFLILIAIVGISIWYISAQVAAARREAAEQEARIAAQEVERQHYLEAQAAIADEVATNNEDSLAALEKLPEQVERAEKWLDHAQTRFVQRAFAPFWDSVENAALALGSFDEGVRKIQRYSQQYINLSKQYRGDLPRFAISSTSGPKLNSALSHLGRVLGKDFSSTFETSS